MCSDLSQATPLYAELADKLREDISAGIYKPGDQMPSEPTLCETTGYSRSTVRKALQLLVEEGYVTRSQGKGTFVSDVSGRASAVSGLTPSFLSYTENVRSLGGIPDTHTLDIRVVPPTAGLKEFFGITDENRLFEVTRLRSSDGEPICLETIWLPMLYADLTGRELDGSIYLALRERYAILPENGTKFIGICHANNRESFQLRVERDTPLLLIEDHVYDQRGRPLHVTKQVMRGDKHRYSMHIPSVEM